jgi:hypothetical protein
MTEVMLCGPFLFPLSGKDGFEDDIFEDVYASMSSISAVS